MLFSGKKRATKRGSIPPTENARPEAKAACMGFALLVSFNPSSSRMCAPKASFSVNSFATVNAVSFFSPLFCHSLFCTLPFLNEEPPVYLPGQDHE